MAAERADSARKFDGVPAVGPDWLENAGHKRRNRQNAISAANPPVGVMQGVCDTSASLSSKCRTAYGAILEPFHGWLLKNTFSMALAAVPVGGRV